MQYNFGIVTASNPEAFPTKTLNFKPENIVAFDFKGNPVHYELTGKNDTVIKWDPSANSQMPFVWIASAQHK
jgi:hypothetical protein